MTRPGAADLDGRLAALYAGGRCDVTPRADATSVVLGQVRRARRRRRTVRAGASVLAACVLGGVALSDGFGRWGAAGEPAPPASSVPQIDGRAGLAITGQAVGPVRLGMTRGQAEATGLLVLPAEESSAGRGCMRYEGRHGILGVAIDDRGVAWISVDAFIRTHAGIGIGDSYAALHAAYPDAVPATPGADVDDVRVPVPGERGAWYVFSFSGSDGGPSLTSGSRIGGLAIDSGRTGCP